MVNIKHINPQTRLACLGILIPDGVNMYGCQYKCSICGKTFTVDAGGNVIL